MKNGMRKSMVRKIRRKFTFVTGMRNALSLSPDLAGLKILEVGCGGGDFAIHLAKQKAEVTAVDFSSKALESARERAKIQNKRVAFQAGDAEALPFIDNFFDLLFSCECLEHVPSPRRAVAEFYRVLKPSGKLILTTENYSNAMVLAWIMSWLRKEPFNSGTGVQPIEHFFLYWRIKKMLTSNGFKVRRTRG